MDKLTSVLIAMLAMVSFNLAAAEEEEDVNNRTKVAPTVEEMDSDGDGVVSQEEFNQFRLGSSDSESEQEEEQEGTENDEDENRSGLSAFASFDKDKDGFVTQEELNAHAKYSNPGNGTGELKTQKQQMRSSSEVGSQSKSNNKGGNSNKGSGSSNRGGGNKGGSDKGGKGKDK